MKTAYELAMERLNKTSPAKKLTARQKEQLAELDSQYAARIAGREVTLKDEINKAAASGDMEKLEQLQQQSGPMKKNAVSMSKRWKKFVNN